MRKKIIKFKEGVDYILPVPRKGLIYSVMGYISDIKNPVEEMIDNKGYIDQDGKVYICSKDEAPLHKDVPIVIVNKKTNELEYIEVAAPATQEEFVSNRIYELSLAEAFNTPIDAKFFDENILNEMSSTQEIYRPKIKEEDDALKKIVKAAIISKGVDLNVYKTKIPDKPYVVSNIKHCIEGSAKMSIMNLDRFCELYELDYEIHFKEKNTDILGRLKKEIVYDSKTDVVDY